MTDSSNALAVHPQRERFAFLHCEGVATTIFGFQPVLYEAVASAVVAIREGEAVLDHLMLNHAFTVCGPQDFDRQRRGAFRLGKFQKLGILGPGCAHR